MNDRRDANSNNSQWRKDEHRRTKILATLGPAIYGQIDKLMDSGANGFRFNMSHVDYTKYSNVLDEIRSKEQKYKKNISCLADLQGPKIRIKNVPESGLEIQTNDTITIHKNSKNDGSLTVNQEAVIERVGEGTNIFLNDGSIKLVVTQKNKTDITCTVKRSGSLRPNAGVNLPDTDLGLPPLTEKDESDLQWVLEHDFDTIALSFVRKASDIDPVLEAVSHVDRNVDIIAKIETKKGFYNLESIIEKVDGVMVARGDLGAELGPERMLKAQKEILEKAQRYGRSTITATQMLESMIETSHPTRAEVSDVGNAILDGSGAVMLSGETAVGENPVRTVEEMKNITLAVENDFHNTLNNRSLHYLNQSNRTKIGMVNAAVKAAIDVGARAIAVPVYSGRTARYISCARPPCPIIALCNDNAITHKTALYGGVHSYNVNIDNNEDDEAIIDKARTVVQKNGHARDGDSVIILASLPFTNKDTFNNIRATKI